MKKSILIIESFYIGFIIILYLVMFSMSVLVIAQFLKGL